MSFKTATMMQINVNKNIKNDGGQENFFGFIPNVTPWTYVKAQVEHMFKHA